MFVYYSLAFLVCVCISVLLWCFILISNQCGCTNKPVSQSVRLHGAVLQSVRLLKLIIIIIIIIIYSFNTVAICNLYKRLKTL